MKQNIESEMKWMENNRPDRNVMGRKVVHCGIRSEEKRENMEQKEMYSFLELKKNNDKKKKKLIIFISV